MHDLVPKDLEETLLRYVTETYLPKRASRRGLRFFMPSIADLSASFTSERRERSQNYLNHKEFRSAYLLYFFLTNYAKVRWTLQELDRAGSLPLGEEVSILDLGAGPGTASIAAAHYYAEHHPECSLQIEAFEQNREIIKDARRLFSLLAKNQHSFAMRQAEIRPNKIRNLLSNKRYDLIIAANLLNELGSVEKQTDLCRQLISRHLKGRLIIIDPALRMITRNLMELRDRLLERREACVVAPCLHQARCPMRAANKRDWCHTYIEWNCPQLIREIDRAIGNKHDHLKMAYFLFAPSDAAQQKHREDLYRVVSSPLFSKGKAELILCGANGQLRRIRQLDRDRQKKEKPFGGAERGDLLLWP